jgi:hypothetical protein
MQKVQIGSKNTFGFIDLKASLAKTNLSGIDRYVLYEERNMTGSQFFTEIKESKNSKSFDTNH